MSVDSPVAILYDGYGNPIKVVLDGAPAVATDPALVVAISPNSPAFIAPYLPTADAFHRLRVSSPARQLSSMSEYPDFPFLWETATIDTGSVTWEQYLSSQRLSTGGTD